MAKVEAEPEESEPPMVEQLRQAIRASGRALQEISRECGVDASRISRFLHGKRTITLDAAGRICQALGITLDVPPELQVTPTEPPPEPPPAPKKKPKN